jgi:LmbE family N-acetylglucosaminyl deacetylase
MDWIYISPHLDDVVLSVGGLLWEQTQAGQEVSVWTLCAGDPPPGALSPIAESLHIRWQVGREALDIRRKEDQNACSLLGAAFRHFSIPDCIYRRSEKTGEHLYPSEDSLFSPLHPDESILIERISETLRNDLPADANLVCPLALGGHTDHRLTRRIIETLDRHLWYYADYPYVLKVGPVFTPWKWAATKFNLSKSGMRAWQTSVEAHQSQISTFWSDLDSMRAAIQSYGDEMGGVKLWRPE